MNIIAINQNCVTILLFNIFWTVDMFMELEPGQAGAGYTRSGRAITKYHKFCISKFVINHFLLKPGNWETSHKMWNWGVEVRKKYLEKALLYLVEAVFLSRLSNLPFICCFSLFKLESLNRD